MGITFCGISYPALPDQVNQIGPGNVLPVSRCAEVILSCSVPRMKQVSEVIRKFRGISDVFAYFNNDIHAAVVRNAREFSHIITSDKVPQASRLTDTPLKRGQ